MPRDCPIFACLIADAYRAVRALDTVRHSGATPAALRYGRRTYSQLLDYRKNSAMTPAQSALVQTALELIWPRLRASKIRRFGSPALADRVRPR
jgi:hypothetical protein